MFSLHAAPAEEASAQQENLFAFIDSVMQQAVPPSVDARAEAAAAACFRCRPIRLLMQSPEVIAQEPQVPS